MQSYIYMTRLFYFFFQKLTKQVILKPFAATKYFQNINNLMVLTRQFLARPPELTCQALQLYPPNSCNQDDMAAREIMGWPIYNSIENNN